MNHPTREEWVAFIYGESNATEQNSLAAHLRGCRSCQAQLNEWRGAQKALNHWLVHPPDLARSAKRAPTSLISLIRATLKWAAAALLLLCVGFGLGQLTAVPMEANRVRAMIEPELRQELRGEMMALLQNQVRKAAVETLAAADEDIQTSLADYAQEAQAKHDQDSQSFYATLHNMDAQRLADYLLLKKQLDTVAVNTDADLRTARQQILQLADYKQPVEPTKAH